MPPRFTKWDLAIEWEWDLARMGFSENEFQQ